jgi:two-component system response regulator HydG
MIPKILVVDDDPAHRKMLQAVLAAEGYEIHQAEDGTAAVSAVETQSFDLILMDIRMAPVDGMTALKELREVHPGIPVVMMTAYASVGTAVEALRSGAHDYLIKPIDIEELKILVEKTLKHSHLEQENRYLKERLGEHLQFDRIIGQSRPMVELFETLALVAPTEATVLITGESGTGKELIAGALHAGSPRSTHPLIKISCAALPETLLESELFGHEKGAFTGADARKQGRFQLAHSGTVFLDEIGEMPLSTQVKILRVLQEREFEPVGGTRTLQVDIRVIAATNKNLEAEIAADRFREDLFYRLNVVTLHVPALRDRREDIPLLADFFLKRYAEKNRRHLKGFSPRATDILTRHSWPGNVRELENVIERAVILSREDVITPSEFPDAIQALDTSKQNSGVDLTPGRSLKAVERQMILRTLEETGGNRTHAADILGISRRTLQLKLKEYGIN